MLESPEQVEQNPVSGGLYSYASNDPLNRNDPDGDLDLEVNFNGDRNSSSSLTLKDDFGNEVMSVNALGRGEHRDQMKTYGDTPTGTYKVGKVEKDGSWNKATYGSAKIHLTPLSGDAKKSGRTRLRIHGGKSGSEKLGPYYPKVFKGRNDLRPTQGCLRVCNSDATRLANEINKIREFRKTETYQVIKNVYQALGLKVNSQDRLTVKD